MKGNAMEWHDLTDEDFDLLFDGLDCIGSAEHTGEMLGDMLGAMVCRGDAELQKKIDQERAERIRQSREKNRIRKERIIMLKAKLVQKRQSKAADRLLETR